MKRTQKQIVTLCTMHRSIERIRRDLADKPARLVSGEQIAAADELAAAMQSIERAMARLNVQLKFEPYRRSPFPYQRHQAKGH